MKKEEVWISFLKNGRRIVIKQDETLLTEEELISDGFVKGQLVYETRNKTD